MRTELLQTTCRADMDHRALVVLLSLWSSGFWARDTDGAAVILPDGVRFQEGATRCAGTLEINYNGDGRLEDDQTLVAVACRQLDCGSAVSWQTIRSRTLSPLKNLNAMFDYNPPWPALKITCSESVRLNGTNRCSGRLEVKSDESWSSVCEGEFDQQVAEVVCRELNCGVPSFLQGALYGKVDASVWSREFQCEGNEYHLLECHRSTCSSGRTLGLTCSDPGDVRLVGGASHCSGVLQLKHRGVWRAVNSKDSVWNLKAVNIICHQLDCGSSVSTQRAKDYLRTVWRINSSCFQSTYKLRECLTTSYEWSYSSLEITCSESVRLVNGTSRCSGRLEVKSDESWSSVCEGEFDQQVAEVVCRELDCGVPSVLQGALYGEVEAPVWSREFQCEGNESHLLDCKWSDSAPSTCSPDKAVGLTCSYPLRVRLVGERSRCAGELEVNHQRDWRPVADWDGWDQMLADKVCTKLDCGSAVSTNITDNSLDRLVWWIKNSCAQLESALWECVMQVDDIETYAGIDVICSGLLVQPNVSVSPIVGVSGDKQQGYHVLLGSSFTVTCSTEPQYQEGSFHLLFNTSDMAQNYTLPAVNHSAHFLFPAARSAHRGDYTCVYHVYVFSYNFSSESRPLHLIVSASVTDLIIRCVVALLVLTVSTTILYFHFKAGRRLRREKNLQPLIAQRERLETRQRPHRSTAAAGHRSSRVDVE
ncbi:scavenger receptor cysteine-rich type 1 protein M130-like [Scophthalmus maximus]|uniref:scavenger receptor cysteine-rich type 1 protein M130-like n=1 Tax=Scophthalmus maximus TaxID=52904 RepID=UPI001FA82637|nr:scavenger receptor cysteine-rich type 1 protein M130-like [Scophthalmus maximus]